MVEHEESEQTGLEPTRSQIAEYIHDITGQLAAMARRAGLPRTAESLLLACSILEGEF